MADDRFNHNEPLAFFLTWTTYGTWLPGDERGWNRKREGKTQEPNVKLEAAARKQIVLVQRNLRNRVRRLVLWWIKKTGLLLLLRGPAPGPPGFYAFGLMASGVAAAIVASSPPPPAISTGSALGVLPSRALSSDRISSL